VGAGFVILVLLGLFLLTISIVLFFFFKKRGNLKLGILFSGVLSSIVIVPFLFFVFESEFYFKSDAKEDLKLINIVLKDNFKIVFNKIVGVTDYYQTTYLKISNEDKKRVINAIKNAQNFKALESDDNTLMNKILEFGDLEKPKRIIWNYKRNGEFVREFYYKENNYVPISMCVSVKLNSDTLIIKRIED
jgi:hypothetical protein